MVRWPSVKATAPAALRRPYSASSSPRQPPRGGGVGDQSDAAGFLAARGDQPDQGGVVDRRSAVRQHGDGGNAGGGGGHGGGGDGFTVFKAGLAEAGAHVDQAGAEDGAFGLDDDGAVRAAEVATEIGDTPVLNQ